MTPQSAFMIIAPVTEGKLDDLRSLLSSMNKQPGIANPNNELVPFSQFNRLHFARFFILEDNTEKNIKDYGLEFPPWSAKLVFLGECDGPADYFISELAVRAGPGLRRIFSYCDGFISVEGNLVKWMLQHNVRPAANYVNWIGRTVIQIHEEEALHKELSVKLKELVTDGSVDSDVHNGSLSSRAIRQKLLSFVQQEQFEKRLFLTPPEPTPISFFITNVIHKFGIPLILLVLAPVFLILAPFVALRLRMLERTDPEIIVRPDRDHIQRLAIQEDHDISNQFSAFGNIKPQRFRRYAAVFLLFLINYAARHIYTRGFLARIQTIHFARWVLLDNNRRVLFISNYDGSHESYMDDFINKVAWGLNLIFSNGVGYPSTRWLIKKGAEQELKFKYYQRGRQLPTQVWYKAYPDKTAFDLARNSRIRHGVENRQDNDEEIREWLALIQV